MNRDEYFEQLREQVSNLIEKSGLTQAQIAEKSGVKQSEISAFKNKGEGITSIYKINSILEALGYEVNITEKTASEKKTRLTLRLQDSTPTLSPA